MQNGKRLRRGFRRQLFVRALKISGLRFGKRSAGAAARLDAFQLSFVNGTRRSKTSSLSVLKHSPYTAEIAFAPLLVQSGRQRSTSTSLAAATGSSNGSQFMCSTAKCPPGTRSRCSCGASVPWSKQVKHWQAVTVSKLPAAKPACSAGVQRKRMSMCFSRASASARRIWFSEISAPVNAARQHAGARVDVEARAVLRRTGPRRAGGGKIPGDKYPGSGRSPQRCVPSRRRARCRSRGFASGIPTSL